MSKAGKFEIIMTPLQLPTILYIIDIPQSVLCGIHFM